MSPLGAPMALPGGIASVQDFILTENGWQDIAFLGNEGGRLVASPSQFPGFPVRELPRDTGFIRYVMLPGHNHVRLISYGLGEGFDFGVAAIEAQAERFEVIGILRDNLQILEVFYYGVFFIPPLLMTMIIAISFTRRITSPIAELTEATRRVAEGDFSVQILSRRGDELGLLVRSFNAMVQDLEKSRAALVKAEKISIWQNMAQQLAHEIKNPLTPIKLSAERVLRRWRNDPEQVGGIIEDSMMAIIQETEGLSTLLNEFRTLSKPMEPSRSSIKFDEVIPELISPYQSSHPNVVFDIAHVAGDLVVKIEKIRFSGILTNLIINAIDAMDGRGSIEIRTDLVKKKGVRYCRISVKDSGKGISRQESEQVFTPYFTTKESGTGLGLSIVERIVSDHGGSIWFNSGEGMGTVFFVDLPAGETEGGEG
jgi:nitrogen fixation/metabolism regulation signal transduction histidine kinase